MDCATSCIKNNQIFAISVCDSSDEEKTVFDWCKEGNVKKVTSLLESDVSLLNSVDEQVGAENALLHVKRQGFYQDSTI